MFGAICKPDEQYNLLTTSFYYFSSLFFWGGGHIVFVLPQMFVYSTSTF